MIFSGCIVYLFQPPVSNLQLEMYCKRWRYNVSEEIFKMCLQCHFLPEAGYSVGHYFEDPLRNPSYLHRFQLAPQANEAWCTKVQQGIKSEFKKWNIFSPIIEKSYNHTQETFFRLHTNVQFKHRSYRDFVDIFIQKKSLDTRWSLHTLYFSKNIANLS